ncbi:MAG: YhfC family intramembrane metalloprotease [Lachnospiraceae bacterium]|nr:YhfC family intramembrane metalloprotease [Lachnospiraceae bacterium]
MTVSSASITCIWIVMLSGIAIPLALLLALKKKTDGTYKAFFWGCIIMFLFSFTLESICHSIIYKTAIGQSIWNNTLAYAIYGGLMAGIFEETGRFFAFKFPLKKQLDKNSNALMFAAGHGGFEVFFILFFNMMNNLTYAAVMKHPDKMAEVFEHATAEQAEQIQSVYDALATTPYWMYLMNFVERSGALVIQFSLTVLVWFAVKKGGKKLLMFPLAIVLHALVDGGMVLVNEATQNVFLTEGFIWLLAIIYAILAIFIWKREAIEQVQQ